MSILNNRYYHIIQRSSLFSVLDNGLSPMNITDGLQFFTGRTTAYSTIPKPCEEIDDVPQFSLIEVQMPPSVHLKSGSLPHEMRCFDCIPPSCIRSIERMDIMN